MMTELRNYKFGGVDIARKIEFDVLSNLEDYESRYENILNAYGFYYATCWDCNIQYKIYAGELTLKRIIDTYLISEGYGAEGFGDYEDVCICYFMLNKLFQPE